MVITANNKVWQAAHGRSLKLDGRGRIMAIVNATPDSFSDGGQFNTVDGAFRHAMTCLSQGADIIDIGGESTRPDASVVGAAEEQDRVLPLIEKLVKETDAVLYIDTYRAQTARLAVLAGAHIVNDVWGLQKDPDMASVVAATGAGVCIMHTGRERQKLADVIDDQNHFLKQSLQSAENAGIKRDAIMLDPGFGFAKDTDENMALMARFSELQALGLPILAGTSRKRFIGTVTGREVASDRDAGTAATTALLRMAGAVVFRVHNVTVNRDALAVADAMLAARKVQSGERD